MINALTRQSRFNVFDEFSSIYPLLISQANVVISLTGVNKLQDLYSSHFLGCENLN